MGRWLSPDPLAGDVANPQSLNRYAYVLNDPTNFSDPLGLVKVPPGTGGGGGCGCVEWGFVEDEGSGHLGCIKFANCGPAPPEGPPTPPDPAGGGGGGKKGKQKIKQVVNLAFRQQKLSECLNEIFGPGNILNNENLPTLDTRSTVTDLRGYLASPQQPVPMAGRGTVLIAGEYFNSSKSSDLFLAATYLHEVGNILAYQRFTSVFYYDRPFQVHAIDPNIKDPDVGAALEECIFGKIVYYVVCRRFRMFRKTSFISLAVLCFGCPILASAETVNGVNLEVKRIERMEYGVDVFVQVANRGTAPVFVEIAGGGPPLELQSLGIEQWVGKSGWRFMAPLRDLPAVSGRKLNPGDTLETHVHLPRRRLLSQGGQRIAIGGKYRLKLQYFCSNQDLQTYLDDTMRVTRRPRIQPRIALSEPFEIPRLGEQ